MSNYKVRPRDLIDLVNQIKSGALILSPHFQRKLVWREVHKIDFIQTILLQYPFPEIFISRGQIDLETQKSVSCVVDGQQRMNTIKEFLADNIVVNGKKYSEFPEDTRTTFLKTEIAVIDLDLHETDEKIIEIFQRLNRTFYALNSIEKLATEYASSEFMLIAKLLCAELQQDPTDSEKSLSIHNVYKKLYKMNPNISEEFTEWANELDISEYLKFIAESPIFTKYEISRQYHLMFTLNILATTIFGIYGRNEQVKNYLDLYSEVFPNKDEVIAKLNDTAKYYNKLNFSITSAWYSKSNSFSLFLNIYNNLEQLSEVSISVIKRSLINFIDNLPDDYKIAARESVNGKAQRTIRYDYIAQILRENIN